MFDIKAIRENPQWFDEGMRRRGLEKQYTAKQFIELDDARRRHVTKLQEAQARRNAASKEIGKAKGARDEATAERLMKEVAELKELIQGGEEEQRKLDAALTRTLEVIPNIPLDDVPVGPDEKANKEVRRVGTPPKFAFRPKQHFEIGEALGLMDFETAAKISGARFVVLKGALARLERALATFMLDIHTREFGYTEYNPPLLVRDHTAFGTGNLPKFAGDLFAAKAEVVVETDEYEVKVGSTPGQLEFEFRGERRKQLEQGFQGKVYLDHPTVSDGTVKGVRPIVESAYWLVPTAEVALTNLVREQILDDSQLPMRLTAWTPCFRAEAGAAGKDTRGMIRQHQFSKVELVSITTPETSLAEHERMTACAEEILKRLGLAYRTVVLSTGDMGFAAQKTYDVEVWLPGQDTYREISSCSVCGDFQARRMGARYRPKGSKEVRYVHTLNGSGLAVGRTLIAVLENYQQEDGTVLIPEVLCPYMGGLAKIG